MAIVLCDGSAASLKAIDLAVMPQLVLRKHKDEQLIMLHGWEDVHPATPGATQLTQAQLQQQATALQSVVNVTIEQIDKNKIAKESLNYKLEMIRLSKVLSSAASSSSAQRVPTPASAAGSKPGTASKNAHPTPTEPPAVSSDGHAAASAATTVLNPVTLIGSYVRDRAQHHSAHAVILGVGNQSNGKTTTVGHVAKEIYAGQFDDNVTSIPVGNDGALCSDAFAAPWSLWFVKPTGPTLRVGAGVKFVVLIDTLISTGKPLAALYYTISQLSLEGRGDRIGVLAITNNGVGQGGENSRDVSARITNEAKDCLTRAGQVDHDASADKGVADGAETTAAEGDASPAGATVSATYPLISTLTLEGNNANPKPTVNDVPQQLIKALAKIKADFLVIPPTAHHTLNETTVLALLGTLRPHVIVPTSTIAI